MLLRAVVLLVSIVAGSLLNVLLPVSILRSCHLHRSAYFFIANVCVTDFLRSSFCLPVILDTVLHSSTWRHSQSACKVSAFAWTLLVFAGLFGYLLIALDRYFALLNRSYHARHFHGLKCVGPVASGWVTCFLLALPPLKDVGAYSFDPMQAHCTFKRVFYTQNDNLAFTIIFVLCVVVVLCVYYRIFVFLRSSRRMAPVRHRALRSRNWSFQQTNLPLDDGIRPPPDIQTQPLTCDEAALSDHVHVVTSSGVLGQKNEHLTRVCFLALLVYAACWLPHAVVCFWAMFDYDGLMPTWLATVATWLTYCQGLLVPCVYLVGHQPFRGTMRRPELPEHTITT